MTDLAPAKVVTLHGGGEFWAPGEPIAGIVKMIEAALAEAKSGAMRACSIAYTLDDGTAAPLSHGDFGAAMGHSSSLFAVHSQVGMRMLRALEGE